VGDREIEFERGILVLRGVRIEGEFLVGSMSSSGSVWLLVLLLSLLFPMLRSASIVADSFRFCGEKDSERDRIGLEAEPSCCVISGCGSSVSW
jgi:hypothetical protein